ncbi:hypothetical protein Patl1_22299 [Pistacia atlantica]|uniref:Uncharacterized protein n=1 Tax=Pistacia atlantica TaxID=434234 RepID=A0ACC0ZW21_9ROSI|nr:hypothetical protein Patl1_22299 [Pistacia atlantica]
MHTINQSSKKKERNKTGRKGKKKKEKNPSFKGELAWEFLQTNEVQKFAEIRSSSPKFHQSQKTNSKHFLTDPKRPSNNTQTISFQNLSKQNSNQPHFHQKSTARTDGRFALTGARP